MEREKGSPVLDILGGAFFGLGTYRIGVEGLFTSVGLDTLHSV